MVRGKKMKNPLRKRLPRELKTEFGKYLVIFLLLVATIGLISGFLIATSSMLKAYNDGFETYNVENGNFLLEKQANKAQIKNIEDAGVTLYENFYTEEALTNESTMRIFKDREEVNTVCLMKGEMPTQTDEIAIDRMYADNNSLKVGDTIESADGKYSWKITGYVALPDYSCLFEDNNDTMFDAVKFGVGIVTPEGYAALANEQQNYSYSWKYRNEPSDELQEKEMAEDLMDVVRDEAKLETFIPRYLNQAITFTGDDFGSDKAMMTVLLYIIIVILAFVFGVTVSNTISKEANVIGTLRASGYTKGELVRHYMTMPLVVTLIGALIGNILGYTVFKNFCAGMYYGSYSLPTYHTLWSVEAFWKTTLVPLALMAVVNAGILYKKLSLSPLQFLRRDLKKKTKKKTFHLSSRIPFFARFRMRVIFQNVSNYVVLLVGILFANLLLMFGLALPAVLDHYQSVLKDNLLSNYQYILQIPAEAMDEDKKLESLVQLMYVQSQMETENEDAEKFSAYSLNTLGDQYKSEEVMLYGIQPDSRYVQIPEDQISNGNAYISSTYADKYQLKQGDTITLKEKYEDDQYTFTVNGIYDYEGGLAIYLSQDSLNETFDLEKSYFSGYFSETPITDIDEKYISTVIDLESLTKVSRQLDVSMGSMMGLVDAFAVLMFMILIYLLSKIIIEKNAQSISMVKILGYSNREISRLYIVSTSIMVVLFLLLSLPVEYWAMVYLFRAVMLESISGWITFYIEPAVYIKMFLLGIGTYAVVAALEYRRICRVPMDEALKNVE